MLKYQKINYLFICDAIKTSTGAHWQLPVQDKHLLSSVNLHFHCSTRDSYNISLKYHNKVNFSNLLQSNQIIITTLHHCLYTCKPKEKKKLSNSEFTRVLNVTTVMILLPHHVMLKLLNYLTDKGKKKRHRKSTLESLISEFTVDEIWHIN